jgi:hypothetical protein
MGGSDLSSFGMNSAWKDNSKRPREGIWARRAEREKELSWAVDQRSRKKCRHLTAGKNAGI